MHGRRHKVNVFSKNIGLQGKSDANVVQPNKVFPNIVMTIVTKAIGINVFFPSHVDQPGLIHVFLVELSKLEPKRIKGLLTNQNTVIGGINDCTL